MSTSVKKLSTARMIVCEKSGRWGAELRRQIQNKVGMAATFQVQEIRSLAACWDEIASAPASMVAFEVNRGNLVKIFEFLQRLAIEYPAARAIIVGDQEMASFEWSLREMGVAEAIFSTWDVGQLLPLITRHLAMSPSRERTLRQHIWDSLPWNDAAEAADIPK